MVTIRTNTNRDLPVGTLLSRHTARVRHTAADAARCRAQNLSDWMHGCPCLDPDLAMQDAIAAQRA